MGDEPRMVRRQEVLPPEGQSGAVRPYRYRHDGWTPRKREQFLEVLRREACISEAARAVGISKTSVTRLRDRDADFDRACGAALTALRPSLLETAYQRAVLGTEEAVFYRGEVVGTRRKVSDAMLRLLIDRGVDPDKQSGHGSGRTIAGRPIPTEEEILTTLHRKLTAIEKKLAREAAAEAAKAQAARIAWADEMAAKGWAP